LVAALYAKACRHLPAFRKATRRAMYQAMAHFFQRRDWTFMNYGYAPAADAHPLDLGADDEPNRYCIQLYHHVAGAVDLAGQRVLEVGSGRGGGASFIKRYLHPKEVVGVDYSEQAVALCRRRYDQPGLRFIHGDAEDLPFEDDEFDAVVNVESSHCYGSMSTFLSEAVRVLRPGGHFLFADFRLETDLEGLHAQLLNAGLEIVRHEDITANVVAALEADNSRKLAQVHESAPRWLLGLVSEFVGAPGSRIHERFSSGGTRYVSYVLKPRVTSHESWM
jgi:SAM-dependent methyltransferase